MSINDLNKKMGYQFSYVGNGYQGNMHHWDYVPNVASVFNDCSDYEDVQ